MHRWLYLIFFLFACTCSMYAHIHYPSIQIVINSKWPNKGLISSMADRRPAITKYPDAAGSPYFNESYKYADVTMMNGRAFTNVKTRIDLVAQETYLIINGVETNISAGMVKEISYADTNSNNGTIVFYKFKIGFPPVDKLTVNHFYLVLAEGRYNFLKLISKSVTEKKNDFSGTMIKEFETYEEYYIFSNGVMKRWKKDKDALLADLIDKQVQVNQFIVSNKINLKNPEQVAKLLIYYNSL